MARQALSAEVYININGEDKLWYSISADRKVTWYLPKDIKEKKQILKNIGKQMSIYMLSHPECSLWND